MPSKPVRPTDSVTWAVFDAGMSRAKNPMAVAGTRREAGKIASRLTA